MNERENRGGRPAAPARRALRAGLLLSVLLVGAPRALLAQADLLDGFGGPEGFGTLTLEPGDDASSASVDLSTAFPDGLNFFGDVYSSIFVNNNGNVTFNEAVPFFIPAEFPVSEQPMIAPWWGDVDTRLQTASIANDVYYFVDEPGGRLVVTWYEVGRHVAGLAHGDHPPCLLSKRWRTREEGSRMSVFAESQKDQVEVRPAVVEVIPQGSFIITGGGIR